MPKNARNASQRANMCARDTVRTQQQKEQRNRLAIERVKRDRVRRHTSGEYQRIDLTGASVRNGDTAADACAEQRLAVEHGANDFRACSHAGGWHRKLDQLAQDLVLGLAHQRNFDALRCQEIGQHFSAVSGEAES